MSALIFFCRHNPPTLLSRCLDLLSSLVPQTSPRCHPPPPMPAPFEAYLLLAFRPTTLLPLPSQQGWREAHGDRFWVTRDYSATLPSHWPPPQPLGPTDPWPKPSCRPSLSLRHWPFPRPSRIYLIYPTPLSPNLRWSSPCPPNQLRFGLRILFSDEFGHDSIDYIAMSLPRPSPFILYCSLAHNSSPQFYVHA